MSNPSLEGFAIAGYRSFGSADLQRVAPMDKVHLVAGRNNAGKSNLLRAVQMSLTALRAEAPPSVGALDLPSGEREQYVQIAILRRIAPEDISAVLGLHVDTDVQLRKLMSGPAFAGPVDDTFWFEFEALVTSSGPQTPWVVTRGQIASITESANEHGYGPNDLGQLSSLLTATAGGEPGGDARRILERLRQAFVSIEHIPPVVSISAFRQITDSSGEEHDGAGLIARLARLQNPAITDREDRARFDAITRFVRVLLEDPNAEIEIPHERNTILVQHSGRLLPLDNLGTGLHQVIILAAAATVLSGHLLCIEEPEIHLHPTLQRRLLRYLHEETDNRYLIATHSAHLLDAGRASITAARLESGSTYLTPVVAANEVAAIGRDLGLRASDLVQSNVVVWVEGPSDRIYIRHWIGVLDPRLLDGIHYSLAFYGGSLLRHLAPNDPAVDEFVSLPRINRNFAVVIDSDKTSPHARLNETKRRVRAEVDSYGTGAATWITKGYTVENYLPPTILRDAVHQVHPRTTCSWGGEPYVNPLGRNMLSGRESVDKTAVAQAAIERWTTGTQWPLDLRRSVRRLVALICEANDLPPLS